MGWLSDFRTRRPFSVRSVRAADHGLAVDCGAILDPTEETDMRKKLIVTAGAAALVVGAAGGGVAMATSDSAENVTGSQADAATEAALKAMNGGRANSVELDSENGATWEVEVTGPDGRTVDVRLDEAYNVVVIEGDSEGQADGGSQDD